MSSEDEEVKDESYQKDSIIDGENTMKILVATDIHLGYEKTTKRVQEDDSFRSFEEILQYAHKYDVDAILLGGDLFHESKPPADVVSKCISLLRQYCLGSRPIKIEFRNEPEDVFQHCFHKTVNYEDPNFNVAFPVFSIHGNHDDPSYGAAGSLDVLASTGLINYFGKWSDVTQVEIPPIILRKGDTNVCLYGLSYMNEQRLSRMIKNDNLQLLRPDNVDTTFNIFVLHQNRAQHSKNQFVPENSLPDFLDLLIWGHEHECRIFPEKVVSKPYYISQPGSSVATSLAKGEAVEKHVGLLKINKDKFDIKPLKLKTVRPFVFHDLILNDRQDEITRFKARPAAVEAFVDKVIEDELIPEAAKMMSGETPEQPKFPLLRLRVFYSDENDLFDPLRLAQKYDGTVANPNDMIILRKCSERLKRSDIQKLDDDDIGDLAEIFEDGEKSWTQTIQGGMQEYFNQQNNVDKLTVLSLTGLNSALTRFVTTGDTTAIQDLTKEQMRKTVDRLMEKNWNNDEDIIAEIKKYRDERRAKQQEEEEEVSEFLGQRKTQPKVQDSSFSNDENHSDDDNLTDNLNVTRGRGRGRARGTRATSSRSRGRGQAKA